LRSGSSNCCCRLLLEQCIVCADFSSTSRDKGVFFWCWVCIKAHRRAWHHSINRNGPRPHIIVLERRGDSRPLMGQKEEKREVGDAEEEDLKPLRFASGSLSLSQPTNWSFLDQSGLYCCARQQHSISWLPIWPSFCSVRGDKYIHDFPTFFSRGVLRYFTQTWRNNSIRCLLRRLPRPQDVGHLCLRYCNFFNPLF
jgi:hypothetical protein